MDRGTAHTAECSDHANRGSVVKRPTYPISSLWCSTVLPYLRIPSYSSASTPSCEGNCFLAPSGVSNTVFHPRRPLLSFRLSPASSILWVELTSHHSLLLRTSAALAPSAGEISPGKNNNLLSYRCRICSHSSVPLWNFSV